MIMVPPIIAYDVRDMTGAEAPADADARGEPQRRSEKRSKALRLLRGARQRCDEAREAALGSPFDGRGA
jgi:hypothetical protein